MATEFWNNTMLTKLIFIVVTSREETLKAEFNVLEVNYGF